MTLDKRAAYATTYEVLTGVAKMMAPIAPFISDEIYTKLDAAQESRRSSRCVSLSAR